MRFVAASVFALFALAPLQRAGAEDPASAVQFVLENRDGGGYMHVSGDTPHLPEGVFLHISLTVKDKRPEVEAAFLRAGVVKGRYAAEKAWSPQKLAPLEYEVRVLLVMESQPLGLRRMLAREFGWSAEHVETIARRSASIGTAEEQADFARRSLLLAKQQVELTREINKDFLAMLEGAPEGREEKLAALVSRAGAHYRQLRKELGSYPVWGEATILDGIASVSRRLMGALNSVSGGNVDEGKREATAIADGLTLAYKQILGRLPARPEGE